LGYFLRMRWPLSALPSSVVDARRGWAIQRAPVEPCAGVQKRF
jgi:hypothetical protein